MHTLLSFRNLNAALRGRCQPRDSVAVMLAQHILWRAAKKGAKHTGTHRFVPWLVDEYHVAQSNDMGLNIYHLIVGTWLFGYANYLRLARRPGAR